MAKFAFKVNVANVAHIVNGQVALWSLVAGAWTERKKMFHGGSFLKLADDDV